MIHAYNIDNNTMLTCVQVRHMVGALLTVGAGNLEVNVIAHKLALDSHELPGALPAA